MMWKDVPGAPASKLQEPTVVTLGVFDGVHRGHQALIAAIDDRARQMDARSLAITFDPHPVAVLAPERAPALLTSIERRVALLAAAHVDHVRVLAFSAEMSRWSPEEFVDRILVDQCHSRHVVVGENFRFGARAAGDVDTLVALGESRGFTVESFTLNGDAEPFSSTRIRAALRDGDVAAAAHMLGRPAEVIGLVVTGEKRGRVLGFPTANVPVLPGSAVPAEGVYASYLVRDGERLPAATSVGTNPTFAGEREARVEAYVLDRDDLDLYDQCVRIEFIERLRPMETFAGVEALVDQMHRDIAETRKILALTS